MISNKNVCALVIIAGSLNACGGGGDSGTSTPVAVTPTSPAVVTPATPVVAIPTTPTAPVVVDPDIPLSLPAAPVAVVPTAPATSTSNLQTTVPTPTYAVGSAELTFFNTLNDFRSKLGLGLLAQNAKLDKASSNHLVYVLANLDLNMLALDANGSPVFHSEDPSRTGYTGITPADRVRVTQYAATYVGEEGGFGVPGTALANLIATVYHRNGLMLQTPRDIGLAFGGSATQTYVIEEGYESTAQSNAADFFGSYPADKQTGVPLSMAVESPTPFIDITYADYASKTSFPINVVSEASTTLVVNSFSVTQAGATTPLSVYQLNSSTSAQDKRYLGKNTAFIVGKVAFRPNTTYNVSFSGTVNGTTVNKNWSFTTTAL